MKFVKFGIFALALGMFIASCGSSETTEATEEPTMEETTEMAPAVEEAPVVEEAPMTDSIATPVAEEAAAQ